MSLSKETRGWRAGVVVVLVLAGGCVQEAPADESPHALTDDGVEVFGTPYFGDLPPEAPLVLLFHQGGSDGRGEYEPLIPWLNASGYRAVAWDLRAGGDVHGGVNRTAAALPTDVSNDFCSAYSDMKAALGYVREQGLADEVVVWGSSYSAALVFRLAAEYPGDISGLVAFSPASGGPMASCRARAWVDRVTAPMLVLRPGAEMDNPSAVEQRDLLIQAGVRFEVIEAGVHGSSMLVDARTGEDMSAARELVRRWLAEGGA